MTNEPGPLRTHGAALRAIRKKDRRTAGDVARYAGITAQTLYNAENGQSNLSRKAIEKVADILGVPVDAITVKGDSSMGASDDDAEPEGAVAA